MNSSKIVPDLPDYIPWTYGGLEQDLVGDFIGKRVVGNKVLVDNSTSCNNNYVEAFKVSVRQCVSASVRQCVSASVRQCVIAKRWCR